MTAECTFSTPEVASPECSTTVLPTTTTPTVEVQSQPLPRQAELPVTGGEVLVLLIAGSVAVAVGVVLSALDRWAQR